MRDRLEADISQDVHASIAQRCPLPPAELEALVDAVMDVISRRARSIHLAFPQLTTGYTTTSTGAE